MLEKVAVSGFRSVEGQRVDLGPVSVFYGPTSGGKSTLFYSLLAFRNFILNPTQALDGIFNLGFQSLGSFKDCVFDHDDSKQMGIGIDYSFNGANGSFGVTLAKATADIRLSALGLEMKTGVVPVPYPLSPPQIFNLSQENAEFKVTWNGVNSTVAHAAPTAETQGQGAEIAKVLNASVEVLRRIDVAPHKRGFFKPSYSVVATSATPTSEDEVASIIINDMNLPGRISASLEQIFGRDFRIYTSPGTAVTFFQTTDKKNRVPGLLVNDGFGVVQVVYILAKLQRVDVDTLLVEEPEIHLHPSVMRQFARELCVLVKEEGKQLLLATHSEQFLVSLLTCVKEGILDARDVRCYYVARQKKVSVFSEQKVHAGGQVDGGLRSFVEAETEDLRSFLSIQG